MAERRDACGVLVWKSKESDILEDLVVDGKIILKLNFKKKDGGWDWFDLD